MYNHNDAMSMLVSKDLVLERFGTPTDIIEGIEYDEYYYDFGVLLKDLTIFLNRFQQFQKVTLCIVWPIMNCLPSIE